MTNNTRKPIPDPIYLLGRTLLKVKKKSAQYSPDEVIKTFELLEDEKIHAQDVAAQTTFSARQVKKLRYIKRHMLKIEFDTLMTCRYYISSIEKHIKKRLKDEKDERQKRRQKTENPSKNNPKPRGKPGEKKDERHLQPKRRSQQVSK